MSIESARAALDLLGKIVFPAEGTEYQAFHGSYSGKVTNLYIPDLDHVFVLVDFGNDQAYLSPFELIVLTH